jgi:hypothetical protein
MKTSAYSVVLALCVSLGTLILFAQHALDVSAAKPANAAVSGNLITAPVVALPLALNPSPIALPLKGRPIHVSLVNWAAPERQLVLESGARLELPTGKRVDVDTHVGATLFIVSSMNSSVNEHILIKSGDDNSLLGVR